MADIDPQETQDWLDSLAAVGESGLGVPVADGVLDAVHLAHALLVGADHEILAPLEEDALGEDEVDATAEEEAAEARPKTSSRAAREPQTP